jgi:hypothetical protein
MPRKTHRRTEMLRLNVETRTREGTLMGEAILEIDLYGLVRSVADKAMTSKSGKVRLRGGLIQVSVPHIKVV